MELIEYNFSIHYLMLDGRLENLDIGGTYEQENLEGVPERIGVDFQGRRDSSDSTSEIEVDNPKNENLTEMEKKRAKKAAGDLNKEYYETLLVISTVINNGECMDVAELYATKDADIEVRRCSKNTHPKLSKQLKAKNNNNKKGPRSSKNENKENNRGNVGTNKKSKADEEEFDPDTPMQGFISAMEKSMGYIEIANKYREVPFWPENTGDALSVGQEVEYFLFKDSDSGVRARNVKKLPKGTISAPKLIDEAQKGTVIKTITPGKSDKESYVGLIELKEGEENLTSRTVEFGIIGLENKGEFPMVGDVVSCKLDCDGKAFHVEIFALSTTIESFLKVGGKKLARCNYFYDGVQISVPVEFVKCTESSDLNVNDRLDFRLVIRRNLPIPIYVSRYTEIKHERSPRTVLSPSVHTGRRLVVIRGPKLPTVLRGFSKKFRKARTPGCFPDFI